MMSFQVNIYMDQDEASMELRTPELTHKFHALNLPTKLKEHNQNSS